MSVARTLQLLSDAEVEFLVIGGWSAIFHGSVQMTRDLDLFIPRRRENAQRLAETLAPYQPRPRGWPAGLPFVWAAATITNNSVLTLTTTLGDIDLLSKVTGLGTYDEILPTAVEVQAFDRTIRTINLSCLIRAKRAAGRPKDLHALPELEGLLKSTSD